MRQNWFLLPSNRNAAIKFDADWREASDFWSCAAGRTRRSLSFCSSRSVKPSNLNPSCSLEHLEPSVDRKYPVPSPSGIASSIPPSLFPTSPGSSDQSLPCCNAPSKLDPDATNPILTSSLPIRSTHNQQFPSLPPVIASSPCWNPRDGNLWRG